jgi:hypothetical protein
MLRLFLVGLCLSLAQCRTHEIRIGEHKNVQVGKFIITNQARTPGAAQASALSEPCKNTGCNRVKRREKESVKNAGCTPTFSCETFILVNKSGCTAHPCISVGGFFRLDLVRLGPWVGIHEVVPYDILPSYFVRVLCGNSL